jgi:nucleotide-binding universal stress UspA family protein
MAQNLFHIFRNTPLGRETLLQSIYFCQRMGLLLTVYIPTSTKFLMYFENDVVQVDLDSSYLNDPETANAHVEELLGKAGMKPDLLVPKHYTASTLPDIPTNFDFMCCPRSISDLSSKIGLGYIGPRVRRIIQAARFPVLMTSPVYKPWQSVAVFFGGSANAINALRLGIRVAKMADMHLDIYTQVGKQTPAAYESIVEEKGLAKPLEKVLRKWTFAEQGSVEDNLYAVPHDALIVLGAYGHGIIRDIMFGSMMEKVQSTIANNLLIAGPKYTVK